MTADRDCRGSSFDARRRGGRGPGRESGFLVVDAANVVGSRPTGWWRDRPGAARKLVEDLRAAAAAGAFDQRVVVVLEGDARRGAGQGTGRGVRVVHAPGHGDETIAAWAAAEGERATVVTADRELASRARTAGATVVGPRWLLERLAEGKGDGEPAGTEP